MSSKGKLAEFVKNNILVLDGAMGTMLQGGYEVKEIHRAYLEAGANMILTNTFGDKSSDNIALSVKTAREAAEEYGAFVGLDVAPTGQLLEPVGDLKFDEAYDIFKKEMLLGSKAGVDAIYIETITDLQEAKCAVLAAKENCDLPVFCTMSFEKNLKTYFGVDIPTMASALTDLGADFLGINCSVGPAEMREMAAQLLEYTHLPVVIKPNAGLPRFENGVAIYDVEPEEFAAEMEKVASLGVSGIGGCCGTTPEFIKLLAEIARKGKSPRPS